ncbi:MAG: hypothetical protein Q8P90_00375 [bacterium]|nr:hypothetical protein [bacterium]
MNNWQTFFKHDPIKPLLASNINAIIYFTKKDLLEEKVAPIKTLWEEKPAQSIIRRQLANGSWKYPNPKAGLRSATNDNRLEKYRQLGFLVEKYGFNRKHISIQKTANYLLSFQTKEGDIRGIYGNQYTPNYAAAITKLLVKAGYEKDARIIKMYEWLLECRQNDSGWALPFRKEKTTLNAIQQPKTIAFDPTKPSSHLITGIVLRALAAHHIYRKSSAAKQAMELLISRFFQRDKYIDRQAVEYWTRFAYPLWQTEILSALDSISKINPKNTEPNVEKALAWFQSHQNNNGLFNAKTTMGNQQESSFWISLAICRVIKRIIEANPRLLT